MRRYPIGPYPTERLMTVEEAERLSSVDSGYDTKKRDPRRRRAPAIWAWQSVEGAMAQSVTDEQVEREIRRARSGE